MFVCKFDKNIAKMTTKWMVSLH